MLYLTYGTQQVMERGFRDLNQRLELYLDGVRTNLPSIESVVVLNIPSWGAGVDLWSMGAAGILNVYYCSLHGSWEILKYVEERPDKM
jgi:diacylglycerol kinase (ATP)